MNKKHFLNTAFGLVCLGLWLSFSPICGYAQAAYIKGNTGILAQKGVFVLPELGFGTAALEPYIDQATMELHHGKHHQSYVNNLNKALKNKKYANQSLDMLLSQAAKMPDSIRNNAGGHYNHSLFWFLLNPSGKTENPEGKLLKAINKDFGSVDNFKEQFNKAAAARFGSGWAWLCIGKDGKLFISHSPNQDNPLMLLKGQKMGRPILTLDVWEHAYYLKYQNRRPDYVKGFWQLLNWNSVATVYEKGF